MKAGIVLALQNFVWVLMITVNSRIINAHSSLHLWWVLLSQLTLSLGYFVIVKSIHGAKGPWGIAGYCAGGGVGGVLGVFLTGGIH